MLCLLVLQASPTLAKTQSTDALRQDLSAVRAAVYPALVNISVVMRYYDGGRAQRSPAGGSGVIISKDGYVLTNFHVAGHTTHIVCTLLDGEVLDADDVADDVLTDLSVLKLRLSERPNPHAPLHYAVLGNSDNLQVGDFVLAMGNPLMLSSSITLGVVSNTKRVFTDFTGTQMEDMEIGQGEKSGILTRWIQHDALILPGNSGGPLVNMKGEVVGINELGAGGAGFAIPSNLAAQVYRQVVHYGSVRRGWLGLGVLPVQKVGRTTGALVASVTAKSSAEAAGIRPGDILLSIDGQPTNVQFFEEAPLFYQCVAAMPVGRHVQIRLLRNGTPETVTATIQPMENFLDDEREFRTMGVTVRDLTPAMARERFLPSTDGVLITGVRPGYPFETAQPPLAGGDIIHGVDGHAVTDLSSLRSVINGMHKSEFPVSFQRKDEFLIAYVKKDAPSSSNDGGDLPQAWLGVKTQVLVPDLARSLGCPDSTGFRITQVMPWTEAAKAGLKVGDIITELNGSALDATQLQDSMALSNAIEQLNVGDKASLTVLRDGKPQQVAVILEPTPATAADAKSTHQEEFDFVVREITLADRSEHHWSHDQKGLLVQDVTFGGWADVAGLRLDDLLLTVNGQPVAGVDQFKQVMSGVLRQHPKIVTLFVRRKDLTHFVFIEPDWSKLVDSD